MKLKLTKNLPYYILFAACVGVTYLNNYELTFGIWMMTLFVTFKPHFSNTLVKYSLTFLAIILISVFTGFFYENSIYESIRDLTYLVKPIVGLIIGYQLCRNLKMNPFSTLINIGIFIALIHLGIIFYNAVVHKILNIHILRGYAGFFSDFEIYALILAIFHKQVGLNFPQKKALTIIAILAVSSLLYVSRINFIQFGIFLLGMKGYFYPTKKAVTGFTIVITIILVGYAAIYNMHSSRNGRGMDALIYKIQNAPIEAFKTKVNKDDYEDFNDNYRSFENITAAQQVSYEGTSGILFGKGLGATIDIGRRMYTNEGTYVRHEPILHNAYMTVFLKSGLTGIFFMFVFLYLILRQGRSDINEVKQINLLLISTGVFLIMANWVMLGLFLKLDNKSIIIGFLVGYKEMIIKDRRLAQNLIDNG